MNRLLKEAFDKTVSIFKNDPRVVAAYHSGSVGTDREDEFSDVDPVFVIKLEEFLEFDKGLRQLFEREVAKTTLWWPERWIWGPGRDNINQPRNYAIFFNMDGTLLQYDINIAAAPKTGRIKVSKDQFIFDKVNLLEITSEHPSPVLDAKRLVWTIEMYWIYVYIHTKYIKRRDLFKLLYAQEELFHEHLDVLRYLQGVADQHWWPLTAKKLDEGIRNHLLVYFGRSDVDSIAKALKDQITLFSNDARQACVIRQVEYPEEFEASVIQHLEKNGIFDME